MRGRVNAIRTFKGLVADLRLNIEFKVSFLGERDMDMLGCGYIFNHTGFGGNLHDTFVQIAID